MAARPSERALHLEGGPQAAAETLRVCSVRLAAGTFNCTLSRGQPPLRLSRAHCFSSDVDFVGGVVLVQRADSWAAGLRDSEVVDL